MTHKGNAMNDTTDSDKSRDRNLTVSPNVHRQVRAAAAIHDRSIKDLTEELIIEGLERLEQTAA